MNHLFGYRAGHYCCPRQAIRQEGNQLAICSRGNYWAMVPSTWIPSFTRVTSGLWLHSHSPHPMEIEIPLEPIWGESLQIGSNRPHGHPMVDQGGKCTEGSPNDDHRCRSSLEIFTPLPPPSVKPTHLEVIKGFNKEGSCPKALYISEGIRTTTSTPGHLGPLPPTRTIIPMPCIRYDIFI